MADAALQALLDPSTNTTGMQIIRRVDDALGTTSSYYISGRVGGAGKEMWVNVVTGNTDAQKNTAIRLAFNVA